MSGRQSGLADSNSTLVSAIHPGWRGLLRLSNIDRSVIHEGYGSKGTYELSNGTLIIRWEKFDPDVFIDVSGTWLHQSLLKQLPDIEHAALVQVGGRPVRVSKVQVVIPGTDYEVCLRPRTSDIPTFVQIFVSREYDTPDLPNTAEVIVDLGANIGLATVFFGLKYPEARILSIEPEAGNFAVMTANTAALGDRVRRRPTAVWTRDGLIDLRTRDAEGNTLGAWGVQVADSVEQPEATVTCHKLSTLLDQAGFRRGCAKCCPSDVRGAARIW